MILMFIPAAFLCGCGGSGDSAKRPSREGVAAVAMSPAGMTFAVSEKDAFNPGNTVESKRKSHLTAFGAFRGTLPPETLTLEAATVVLNPPDMRNLGVGLLINEHLVITSFPFDYENDIASLKSLNAMHSLDRVIRADMTEMEKFAALCTYTQRFLSGGKLPGSGTISGPSAFLITRNMREKGIGGSSETYAALMCQLVLSCGYTARMVSMHTLDDNGNPLCHDICEVYVNALGKWVAFDPYTRATYYTREMTPLSALELHSIAMENRFREITPVSGVGEALDIVSVRETILPRYRHLYLWRMNDILGRSPRNGSIPWQTLYDSHLVWEDRYSPVSRGGFEKLGKFPRGGVRYVTQTRSDFEWNLNVVNLTFKRPEEETVILYFNTMTPNFDHFNLKAAEKTVKTSNIYTMNKTFDRVIINTVNAFGIEGRISAAEIVNQ